MTFRASSAACARRMQVTRAQLALLDWDLREGVFSVACAMKRASGKAAFLREMLSSDAAKYERALAREAALAES